MKKIIAVAILLFLGEALAADISWMYVQNRRYESGRKINRLAFGLIDEKGNYLADSSSIVDVRLFAPGGKQVKLKKFRFDSDEEIFGLYDAIKSQWFYSDTWQFDSWFRANFSEPLIPGKYRLKVSTIDGKTAERTYNFTSIVELPVISSKTFTLYPDSHGNVIWKWDVPENLGHMIFNYHTEVRASIDINKDTKHLAYFFVNIPSHMGYVYIPRHVVQKISEKGNQFGLRVQLETGDKNSRTYSNTMVITDIMATITDGNSGHSK